MLLPSNFTKLHQLLHLLDLMSCPVFIRIKNRIYYSDIFPYLYQLLSLNMSLLAVHDILPFLNGQFSFCFYIQAYEMKIK